MPDRGMRSEREDGIDRYLGKGDEDFFYSLRLAARCKSSRFETLLKKEEQLALARGRKSWEWKVFELPRRTDFQEEKLQKAGYRCDRRSRLFYAPSSIAIQKSPEIQIEEVRTDAKFQELLDVGEAAFGKRSLWLNDGLRLEVREVPHLVRAFIARIQGRTVAAAWIKIFGPIGFLFGGGTHPDFRGRGAYRSLVAARAGFAHSSGVPFVLSECSPDSEKVLKALSFLDAGRVSRWVKSK